MARKATKRIPVRPETKDLFDEEKPDGVTYDRYIKQLLRGERP